MSLEKPELKKDREEITKNICHILQLIGGARFTANSLSNLVNNLSEGIHRVKCKYGHDDRKCKTCGIKYKNYDCFLEYKKFKDNSIEYKCLICNGNYEIKFDEKLKKRFFKTYKFSNHDNTYAHFTSAIRCLSL